MVRAIMHGCMGRMGQVITGLVREDEDIEIVAGIDIVGGEGMEYPVFKSFAECNVDADVVIDFSSPKAFDAMMDHCEAKQLAVVVCSTGLSEEQIARIEESAKKTAVLRSANMSLGVNTLMKLLAQAVKVLAPAGFDVEIVEKHHKMKKDAPSGTAIALADSMNDAMDGMYEYTYDRSQRYEQRGKNEMGISAVRGGTIVGEHEVIFAGTDEVIEFKHTAYSRAIFAKGAISAAKYLCGKPAGRYDMSNVIDG